MKPEIASSSSTNRHSEVYRNSIRKNFSFLKQTSSLDALFARSIPLDDNLGALIPICELHADDDPLISLLSKWRQENWFAYPTQFPVTDDGTKKWLRSKLLDVEDRILFLVLDKHGNRTGHLGYNSCFNDRCEMEVDNVVRGVKSGTPGIMGAAMNALVKWGRQVIGADGFFLRVFEDNQHAVEFYRRHGWADDQRIPLRKTTGGSTVSYSPVPAGDSGLPDKVFLRMAYAPKPDDIGKQLILTAGPSISSRETFYAWDAARNGWNRQWSHYLTGFERAFAPYVGAKYAMACSSCTGALQIALMALDIGPGDEVIVPDETWVATANAVRYAGAVPIFADIEFDTWNLDAASVEKMISPRTKAIIPVHMYGHPARMDGIMEVARRHNLRVVEDAAPAIGAEWNNRRCGSFGAFGAFSFQGAKLLVTGEGGMLVTSDESLYQKAFKIWDQGRNPAKAFWIDAHGVKFKMSNVQAAIGLGQLERCDELIEMKRRVFQWYAEGLADVSCLRLNREVPGARSIYWMSSLFLNEDAPLGRDELQAELKKRNIDTRPVFPAISQYPIWERQIAPQPVALRVSLRGMNLPSGVCLRREEVDYICRNIRELLS
jgi:perosamine synthetase